jgi:hypothetical protein
VFFALKMSNSDSSHVFTHRGVISRKNFENFFMWEWPNSCFWAKNTPRQNFYRFWTLQKEIASCGIEPDLMRAVGATSHFAM